MKSTLAILALLGFGITSSQANSIAIFKRAETYAGTYSSQQLTPPAGKAAEKVSYKQEAFEIIDLDAKARIVINVDLVGKKYFVNATESTLGYSILKLRVPGTSLWYRAAGETGQAEIADVLGFDYFPDAVGNDPAGDGVPDYFSTWLYTQAETGRAGPVRLSPTVTLNVPTTISILGDSAEQYEDQGEGDRGVGATTIKGTVVLDRPLSTRVNTGTPLQGFTVGTLAYGQKLVEDALVKLKINPVAP
jgi:hypothetical protein